MSETDEKAEQERRERLSIVQLGIEFEQFFGTGRGRYLIKRAEEFREEALAELVKVNPYDANAVQRAQNAVHVVDLLQQWMADAMMDGHNVEHAMKQEDIEGSGPTDP
jgi:hypothetical protein